MIALMVGSRSLPSPPKESEREPGVPSIGSVQVLNGCGVDGAAGKVAEFLRGKGFDVKDIGNAPTWNYPFTVVVSRTPDKDVATQVAEALHTDKVVLMRTNERLYDAVVFAGPDYAERIDQ